MKITIIPALFASALLVGCNSSSGGGGGSSPSVESYSLQFVQLVEVDDDTSSSCTLFESDDVSYYAKLASVVTVKTYDENGEFVEDLTSSVSSAGILKVTENDISEGGYLSVISSESDNYDIYSVLSIQKSFLDDFIISVDREQGNVSCYTKNKGAFDSGYASVTLNGIPASTFGFDSSQTSIEALASTSQEMEAYKDEEVLVRAYDSGELVDYAFISNLTTKEHGDLVPLYGNDLSLFSWSNLLDADELTQLSIYLNQGDYSYSWLDADFDSSTGDTTDFTYADIENSWNYNAQGTTTSNWEFELNDVIDSTLDVMLPDHVTLSDSEPSITTSDGTTYLFKATGVDSSLTRLQRSEYKIVDSSTVSILNHVIYSEVESGDDVIIPNLELDNLDDPETASTTNVSVLVTDDLTQGLHSFFVYENTWSDSVGAVLPPADIADNNKIKYTNSYTLLGR